MPAKTSRFAAHEHKLAAEKAAAKIQATQCKLCRFLAHERTANPIDAAHVQNMLDNEKLGGAYIATVLNEDGQEITESSVKRHRRLHMSA